MKKRIVSILFVLSLASAAKATDGFPWQVRPIRKVESIRSSSTFYKITFESRCNDIDAKGIRFTTETETVLGVAVRLDPTLPCDGTRTHLREMNLSGNPTDPVPIQTLEPGI